MDPSYRSLMRILKELFERRRFPDRGAEVEFVHELLDVVEGNFPRDLRVEVEDRPYKVHGVYLFEVPLGPKE